MRLGIILFAFVALAPFARGSPPSEGPPAYENADVERDKCFCSISGTIDDCCCDYMTLERLNAERLGPRLDELLHRMYFRLYQVNLDRPCPYWRHDAKCLAKGCEVQSCASDEIPDAFKAEHAETLRDNCDAFQRAKELGELDVTHLTDDEGRMVNEWRAHDESEDDTYCELDQESEETSSTTAFVNPSTGLRYVDLRKNPERFTGYAGGSAQTIWMAIYKENCFNVSDIIQRKRTAENPYVAMSTVLPEMCVEKRIFYRIISGMHASINVHSCAQHYDRTTDSWGPNLNLFLERFGPTKTHGEGPTWVKNIYTLYALVLRAIIKANPVWKRYQFFTGDSEEDQKTSALLQDVLAVAESCPGTFDEYRLFAHGDRETAETLRREFRDRFKNITRIMDCVGCTKCKMWGKLQAQGVATALKILFADSAMQHKGIDPHVNARVYNRLLNLRRTEVVSIFNALGQLSESLRTLQQFRTLTQEAVDDGRKGSLYPFLK